jgi:hypothetical protein
MLKRALKILAAVLAFGVLVLAVLSALFVDTMRPLPAAPELSSHTPVPLRRVTLPAALLGDTGEEQAEIRLYGRIEDADTGALIERARVISGAEIIAVEGGRYEVWVSPTSPWVQVGAPGYWSGGFSLPDSPDSAIEYNFALLPSDRVAVFCAGLPGDACADVLLSCGHPLLPMGEVCDQDGGYTVCDCPDGEAAIRGGGRSVLIGPDDTEAWLDFRDTGSISGRLVASGEPVPFCNVGLLRVPVGLEDLPRGLVVAQKTTCDAEGYFTLPGLVSGDWELLARSEADSLSRTLTPRRLAAGEHLDIGDVELWAGGGIEGVLVDGLTGQPTRGPIIALRAGEGEERITPMGDDADSTGHFQFDGLPPGRWRVFGATSPHESVVVEVEDGAITDGVEVRTSDATALATNGFTLSRDGDVLVVDTVSPGSPAWDAGLEEGDRIVGITMAGFSLDMGDSDIDLARLILGSWDGPGITLRVEGADGPEEIPLTW